MTMKARQPAPACPLQPVGRGYVLTRDLRLPGTVALYAGDRIEWRDEWNIRRDGCRVGDDVVAGDVIRRFTSTDDPRLDAAQRVVDSAVRASIYLPRQALFESAGWAEEFAGIGITAGDVLVLTDRPDVQRKRDKRRVPQRFHGQNVRAVLPPHGYAALRDFLRRYPSAFSEITPTWVHDSYKTLGELLKRFRLEQPRVAGKPWMSRLYIMQPNYPISVQADDDIAAIDALLRSTRED